MTKLIVRLIEGALGTYSNERFHEDLTYAELKTLLEKKPSIPKRQVVALLHSHPISILTIVNILHIITEDCVYVPIFVDIISVRTQSTSICKELYVQINELQDPLHNLPKRKKFDYDLRSCSKCLEEQLLHCSNCAFWINLAKDLTRCHVQCCLVDDEILKFPGNLFNENVGHHLVTLQVSTVKTCIHYETVVSPHFIPSDIVYTLKTSGTTGVPKIVSVPNSSILPNILHFLDIMKITSSDIILLCAPLTFDPSIVDIFMALSAGSSIAFLKKESNMINPNTLCQQISQVTVLMCTPSLISLIPGPLRVKTLFQSKLRYLALGGEMFPTRMVENYFSSRIKGSYTMDLKIFNFYGITEQSCWSFIHEFKETDFRFDGTFPNVLLGNLVPGTKYHVKNGQLFLGGVRKCYVNDEKSQDWYATGDGVIVSDDMVYITGRCELDQIKVNGKTICRQLVKNLISQHFHVESYLKFETKSRTFLFLFTSADILERKIRLELRKVLPSYYKFDKIIVYPDAPPLSKHHKIDEKMLQSLCMHLELNETNIFNCVLDFLTVRGHETGKYRNLILINLGLDSLDLIQLANCLFDSMPKLNDIVDVNYMFETLVHFPVNKIWGLLSERILTIDDDDSSCKYSENMSVISKVNMSLCVDSSPVVFKNLHSVMCYCVGSHAGILYCGTLPESKELWRYQLPDRVESSPCYSDGKVYVGCYDGMIYILKSGTGQLVHSVTTGGQVKCTPVAGASGDVYCGSHDGRLYRIIGNQLALADGQSNALTFKIESVQIDDKPIIASPLILTDLIVVCSLSGKLSVSNCSDLQLILSKQLGSPIFSSPVYSTDKGTMYVALVSGEVLEISTTDFAIAQRVRVDGLIYADLVYNKTTLLVATHNRMLHSYQSCPLSELTCLWSTRLTSETSSSPLVAYEYVVLATTDGMLSVINSRDGTFVSQLKLPGHCFSSPKMCKIDSKIYFVVGCRDNYCYVFKLN